MSNARHTTPRRRRIAAAVILPALAAGALAASALPAFAAGGPVSASVVIPSTLTFTFTSGTSFSLAPGVTSMAAVAWTVATNDPAGYSVTEAAPDLAAPGGATLPAGDLSEILHYNLPGQNPPTGTNPAVQLTNAPAPVGAYTHATALDTYSQDWLATIPASTAPGTFSTTISYVAVGA